MVIETSASRLLYHGVLAVSIRNVGVRVNKSVMERVLVLSWFDL
jgi:hypothetical protein